MVITKDEVYRLRECIRELSEYHNKVSVNFAGSYPSRPFDATLEIFAEALERQTSRIEAVEVDGEIAGFCKVDMNGNKGKLDYLIVRERYRGNGYGDYLMKWAMSVFDEEHVHQIEVKVVDGNEAVHLYEKYGFKMNAHILKCIR